ncbi:sugar phosphate isomerase/epimerase family protein [Fimbriiglobus ruber]|uniref:Xylose isomerase-like TIM barrel domain-containing protein n=1 Tax=Fimbriiglobus ruber TaxID=1908690 RepID=A0A225D7M1_9BACT|nr:sugar phosphate isomerase/epimerase [Fimbriiglobus ruber]OWK37452.1 hypothetical protein FRUB_06572 [Fimbriiglobus ruber]
MPHQNRREWLRDSATGLAAVALSTPAAPAADPIKPFRFGFGQYGMLSLSNAEYLKTCIAIGYDCVEFAPQPGWPADPKALTAADRRELRDRMADAGLVLSSLLVGVREPAPDPAHAANLDTLKACAELGHALAPSAPPVLVTNLGGKPEDWENVREKVADHLTAWADVTKAAKTVIAVKPHVKSVLHTPEGGKWVLDKVNSPWLRLVYDYSHYVLQGLKLADTIAAIVPHSAMVHLKDAKGTPDKFEFLLPGDGSTDYPLYAKLLREAGYRGPVVVEVSNQISRKPGYDGVAAAKTCYARLAPALGHKRP